MKIGYSLIKSPFQYNVNNLNDNLEYKPPDHKLVNLLVLSLELQAASRSTCEIKLTVPINDDGGAGGFDYTLQVADEFDDIFINNNLYNLSFGQMCSTSKPCLV